MRELKFRVWNTREKKMHLPFDNCSTTYNLSYFENTKHVEFPMQYTGLKDKNGLTEIYEGDIIDENGLVIGNIYEMDKRETDTVIQGFGTKTWCETVSRAILLGCRYSE